MRARWPSAFRHALNRPAATYNSFHDRNINATCPAPPRLALLPGLLMGAVIALLLAVLMARVQSGPLAAFWSLLADATRASAVKAA